jgi:metal-dependent hydrolase (beta-lactamase superfamily II)
LLGARKARRAAPAATPDTTIGLRTITPQGDILFDTAQEPFVDMIEANIRKIGVDPHDIKYIIINHGHVDHFGSAKRLQEFTRDSSKPTEVPKRDMEAQ